MRQQPLPLIPTRPGEDVRPQRPEVVQGRYLVRTTASLAGEGGEGGAGQGLPLSGAHLHKPLPGGSMSAVLVQRWVGMSMSSLPEAVDLLSLALLWQLRGRVIVPLSQMRKPRIKKAK